ncbi:MAG: hypothetical protein [Bacteriophage sp.]|nr:MAG: hypothetical protein [Bacteriophage sp.]
MHVVECLESERGWGQEYTYRGFDTKEEAMDEVERISALNPPGPVPNWYMVAEYKGIMEELPLGYKV